ADHRYVLHALRQPAFRLAGEKRMTGSAGQRRVPSDFLSTFHIPLPTFSEQKRIAEILDRAEALRAKRRAALAHLDTLTQSIFLEMFGDPAANPKGWPRDELGTVVKVVGGYAFKSEDFVADGHPVIRISNLDGDGVDLQNVARV